MITKEKENKVEYVHFKLEGIYFTWLLRHLWVEGNEIKAVKMWSAAFPEYTTVKHIKELFLSVVNGKMKFVGTNNFDLVKEGTKYWTERDGTPNRGFPLLQSWEDVILLKRAKLYLAEINLRNFRLNRRYGHTQEEVHNHAFNWLSAAEENNVENGLREKVNEYYTSIRNLSMLFGGDLSLELLPEKTEELNTKAYNFKGSGFKQTGDTGINNGVKLFMQIMKTITPWQIYFKKKYGYDMLFVNEDDIREMCGCSTEKVKRYFKLKDIPSEEEILDRIEASIPSTDEINSRISSIIPGLNLDGYIKGMLKESNRKEIVPENVVKTTWQSGYINPQGEFFGCSDINHINFSEDICKMLNVKKEGDKLDAQVYLDEQGWIKISVNRFNWDPNTVPTQTQKDTIFDYMKVKGIKKTTFDWTRTEKTFEEAFGEDK